MVDVRFWRETIDSLKSDVEDLSDLTENYFEDLNKIENKYQEEQIDEEFLRYGRDIVQGIIGRCKNLL